MSPPSPPPTGPFDERGLPSDYRFNEAFEIAPAELKAALDAGGEDVLLIDCRERDEHAFTTLGRGERLVPLGELVNRADELRDEEGKRIVVYCRSGGRSMRAATALTAMGVKNVKSLAGGVRLWSTAVDQTIPMQP